MKTNLTTPAFIALEEERRGVQAELEKTQLGWIANHKTAAARRWVKTGSAKDLRTLENLEDAFERESRNDPTAFHLHVRHIELQAQIKAHREALGFTKTKTR